MSFNSLCVRFNLLSGKFVVYCFKGEKKSENCEGMSSLDLTKPFRSLERNAHRWFFFPLSR